MENGMDAIGFIGFGEAAHVLARGLNGAGAQVLAWDIDLDDPARHHRVKARARDAGIELTAGLTELAERCGVLLSTVVSSAAVVAAESAASHLGPRHLYLDLNSTSPAVKQEVGRIVSRTGARFVEAAVMASVPKLELKVPILICGEAAGEARRVLARYGMNLEDFGPEIGRASAVKMFRSIVVKGLEALLLECALGAERYGVTERVLDYVEVGYPGLDWNRLAHFLLGRTAIHGERRGHEMLEVADTLRALGIEPVMSQAAAKRLLEAASHGLKSRFADAPPENYHEVVRAIQDLASAQAQEVGRNPT
jgi:3-hydroxyisobutyrate dehydrogenase-like beta-hydroxyacid dehydrogenase